MHGAGGECQLACDILGAETASARIAEYAANALDQQPVAPIGQYGQPQRALEHVVEVRRAPGERQRQVMLVEGDGSAVRIEANVSAKDGRIDRDMTGLGVRRFRGAKRDPRIYSSAGKAENIAEQGDQAEFA